MFKKENRLSTNFEFNITRKYGKKIIGQYFVGFVLLPKNYDGPTKVGIVVSNKVHKKAVKRNRLKRLYREAVKSNLNKFPNNYWIVIQPRSLSLDKKYEEISTDFNKALSKVSFS